MIELQRFTQEDIKQFISWGTDERFLLQFAGPQYKLESLENQLLDEIEESDKEMPHSLLYKVVNVAKNQVIGHIQLFKIDWDKREAIIGRVIIGDDKSRGKGLGAKIISCILKIAFEDLNFEQIYINVYDFNIPAIRCYDKVGFDRIGLVENAAQYKDEIWSMIKMSMSKEKYYLLKQ